MMTITQVSFDLDQAFNDRINQLEQLARNGHRPAVTAMRKLVEMKHATDKHLYSIEVPRPTVELIARLSFAVIDAMIEDAGYVLVGTDLSNDPNFRRAVDAAIAHRPAIPVSPFRSNDLSRTTPRGGPSAFTPYVAPTAGDFPPRPLPLSHPTPTERSVADVALCRIADWMDSKGIEFEPRGHGPWLPSLSIELRDGRLPIQIDYCATGPADEPYNLYIEGEQRQTYTFEAACAVIQRTLDRVNSTSVA